MPQIHITLLGRFAVTVRGNPVDEASWKRRHAAAVVKVLALAPGRRLHREQVIDRVRPTDTIAEAVPKLHKAAHFARRAIGVPDAVVLRGDQVSMCPGSSVTVDAVRFEDLVCIVLAHRPVPAARTRYWCWPTRTSTPPSTSRSRGCSTTRAKRARPPRASWPTKRSTTTSWPASPGPPRRWWSATGVPRIAVRRRQGQRVRPRERPGDAARIRPLEEHPFPVRPRRRAGLAAQGSLSNSYVAFARKPGSLRPRCPDIP